MSGLPSGIVIQNGYKYRLIHTIPLGKVNKNTIFIARLRKD
nr:hypothetical protein [uncultured Chryseobacterium sp.]